MKNKEMLMGIFILVIFLVGVMAFTKFKKVAKTEINSIEATVLSLNNSNLIVQDSDNAIYTFKVNDLDVNVGEHVILEYMGILNKMKTIQDSEVVSYKVVSTVSDDNVSDGIFSKFYKQALDKLEKLSLDEKIKQLLLIRYSDSSVNGISGYVFYEKDFKGKEAKDVQNMINNLQTKANIPLLTAVDEEGGKIIRISSNDKLVASPFKSAKELYEEGGMSLIAKDTKEKSAILSKLGLNVNLAPVVDIADNTNAYIYSRTIGYGRDITATYASEVIKASKGTNVSYTLKHFPGYGNNDDTHINSSRDIRSYDDLIDNDIIPFKRGIEAGAEAVLVSHNIITSIDEDNPATLSSGVHNLLKVTLGFTGVTITDDLDMGATKDIENKYLKAILAGNELLIVTDYESAYNEIKTGIQDKVISEDLINDAAMKILAWKYYKGLMLENEK